MVPFANTVHKLSNNINLHIHWGMCYGSHKLICMWSLYVIILLQIAAAALQDMRDSTKELDSGIY
jgi:hypothetical protein